MAFSCAASAEITTPLSQVRLDHGPAAGRLFATRLKRRLVNNPVSVKV
jgi:hypothetical protein